MYYITRYFLILTLWPKFGYYNKYFIDRKWIGRISPPKKPIESVTIHICWKVAFWSRYLDHHPRPSPFQKPGEGAQRHGFVREWGTSCTSRTSHANGCKKDEHINVLKLWNTCDTKCIHSSFNHCMNVVFFPTKMVRHVTCHSSSSWRRLWQSSQDASQAVPPPRRKVEIPSKKTGSSWLDIKLFPMLHMFLDGSETWWETKSSTSDFSFRAANAPPGFNRWQGSDLGLRGRRGRRGRWSTRVRFSNGTGAI